MKKLYPLLIILFLISPEVFGQKYSKNVLQLISDYHHVGPVSENGLIMVCKKDTEHCGCIDTLGNEVIPFKYGMNFFYFKNEEPQFNSVNRMVAAKPLTTMHAVYGIIDEKGNVILPFKYEADYGSFHSLDPYHIFKTYRNQTSEEPPLYGIVDSLGNIVIPITYEFIKKAGERTFIVKDKSKYGLLNGKKKRYYHLLIKV